MLVRALGLLHLMVVAVAATAGGPPKPVVDKLRPVRMERLFSVRQGETEVARVLSSSLVVLDREARARAPQDYFRYLLRFADGSRVAMYGTGDYRREGSYLIRALVVDANAGEWVLLTTTSKTQGLGYGSARAAMESEDHRALVGLETRRLRVAPELEHPLAADSTGKAFQIAEPQLAKLIEKVRRSVPDRGDLSATRAIPQMFAQHLALPDVPGCTGCAVVELRHSIANDEPDKPAAPLDPEFEGEFGKWASWRDLPRLKGN